MDVKALIHKHKPLLDIFVGTHAHDKSDGVWADLVTFPTPLTRLAPADLQASVTPFCDQLGALACPFPLSTVYARLLLLVFSYQGVRNQNAESSCACSAAQDDGVPYLQDAHGAGMHH